MKNQTTHQPDFRFRKAEKLCSEKIIAGLFKPGFFVSSYPFRINAVFTQLPIAAVPAQVMFVVGKKRFKRATDRNRVKRIMRELYRFEKQTIYATLKAGGKQAALAIIYTGAELPDFVSVKPKFNQLIGKLNHAINHQ